MFTPIALVLSKGGRGEYFLRAAHSVSAFIVRRGPRKPWGVPDVPGVPGVPGVPLVKSKSAPRTTVLNPTAMDNDPSFYISIDHIGVPSTPPTLGTLR